MSSRIDGASVSTTRTVKVIELPDRLWSATETADFFGVELKTLYQLNTNGTGPRFHKVGRECRYNPLDVLAWLETRASRPAGCAA